MIGVAMVATACTGVSADDDAGVSPAPSQSEAAPSPSQTAPPQDFSDSVVLETLASSPRQDVPSGMRDRTNAELPTPLVDMDRMQSGGPPPDGIRAIDAPRFEAVADVGWLSPEEPVISLETAEGARAYPVQVLMWHEIVNDVVDGEPVTVTYCPLCNTAIAFNRRVNDLVLDFAVSGLLLNSDLVMFDRQTESLWPQIEGEAVAGVLTGSVLQRLPVQMLSWRVFEEEHPDGWVLSRDTGFDKFYGNNPYIGYDVPGSPPMFATESDDDRMLAKERVVAFEAAEGPVALPRQLLASRGAMNVDVDGGIVAWVVGDTNSALDSPNIDEGRPIGMTGVFSSTVAAGAADEQKLTFVVSADDFITDKQTGSTWSVTGVAQSGPLRGERLTPITHVDTFWFAWVSFRPDTELIL